VLPLALGVAVACTTVAAPDAEPSASAPATSPQPSAIEVGAEPSPPLVLAPTSPRGPEATPPPTGGSVLEPASAPSSVPLAEPTPEPTAVPTPSPTSEPAPEPTPSPVPEPTPVAVSEVTLIADDEPTEVEVVPSVDGRLALDEKTAAKLQKIIDNQHANKRVAGLQVAVRLPDGQTWLGSAGNAEFSPDRALDDDDQMAIASITKTFIAALILQLADEGKIDLDATYGTYFRDAPRKDKATVRQLLSHTSGIYNFWANPRYGEITKAWWQNPGAGGQKARSKQWTYDEMMSLVRAGDFKPGEGYQYSNTNYVILGKIAEAVEGKPLHRMLNQRFFKPLGLENTIYQPAQKPRSDAAHGHWDWGGGWTDHTGDSRYVPFMAAASIADAAGAMASTAEDLSAWAAALYGGEVLSDEMLREMLSFEAPGFYGLGTYPARFAGHRGVGHRGGIRGYESAMFHFPEDDVTIVLLSNQGNWGTDAPMTKLVRTVLGNG
jgi:D-alanyl-D-alanine carboxypeptidase